MLGSCSGLLAMPSSRLDVCIAAQPPRRKSPFGDRNHCVAEALLTASYVRLTRFREVLNSVQALRGIVLCRCGVSTSRSRTASVVRWASPQ